ncbi:class I SAM-dependent DNA methyltransferase [Streptomyces sp. NPDC003435]
MTDSTVDFLRTTRSSYDAIAKEYAERFPSGLPHPLDRSLISAFAELVTDNGPAPVADLGSGPGFVTALLDSLGVPVFGVDLSPAMVALAREAHPHLRFHVGSMTALDLPDATLGGIMALYSTIHVPEESLPRAFGEFHRTLRPGAPVLLAFQTGDADHMHLAERFGHEIDLDYWMRSPAAIAARLREAGLSLVASMVREPQGEEARARGFVLARKD